MVPAPRPPSLTLSAQYERFSGNGHCFESPVNNNLDIFEAAKQGNLEECRRIVSAEGAGVLDGLDDRGHTPVHWAALAGAVDVIQFFLEAGGPVDLPSKVELAQRPVHWASVNGHVAVVDRLLEAGVSMDTPDHRGCTPLILAAQYGHTALCCYLIGKGAQLNLCDAEGDNALHWAAFKGHCELTRLLIYSGFNPKQPDQFGQTPLHLAVLSGDLLTVQLLCEQDGVDLETEDKNGNTPLKLSRGRKHREISAYLEGAIARSGRLIPKFDWSALVFGPPGKSKGPVLFLLACCFLWGYPTYFFKIVSVSFNKLWEFHVAFLLANALMWFLFLKASLMDPGFLPRDSEEYDQAIRQAVHCEGWRRGRNPLLRLCHTCHIVRPLRTKHCRVTNRCVEHFDHYCPYIYNAVGRRNRTYFLGFLTSMSVNCFMGVYLCVDWFSQMGRSLFLGTGFLFMAIVGVISGIMAGTCFYMAAQNTTTNERLNHHKYSYLQEEGGQASSLFDRGTWLNLLEFFHLLPPLQEGQLRTMDTLQVI
ncbi:protein S-acyltransferase 24-like [Megalops cyprinoides]|uniref:protein S-acyltransferase 24-like n=1 Tax=Megalops cyprinoides TaxID=118141 RepID=UPI001863E696|nr:protein S-acyltransferase 24-like [Megalops cyprinoides]